MIIRKLSVECPIPNSTNCSLFTLMMFKRGGKQRAYLQTSTGGPWNGFLLITLVVNFCRLAHQQPLGALPRLVPYHHHLVTLQSRRGIRTLRHTERRTTHTSVLQKKKNQKTLVISKKLEQLSNSSSNLTTNLSTSNSRTWFKVSPVLHR